MQQNTCFCGVHICHFTSLAVSCVQQASWRNVVDDFACAIFPPVLFVSFSYYLILYLPLEALYGDNYQVVRVRQLCVQCCCLISCHLSVSGCLSDVFVMQEEQEWDGGLQRLAYQSGARVCSLPYCALHSVQTLLLLQVPKCSLALSQTWFLAAMLSPRRHQPHKHAKVAH